MGSGHRAGKEPDMLTKLKAQVKQLKRDNAQLRKQISRLDLDRYDNIKSLIEKQGDALYDDGDEKLLKQWECWECGQGVLKMCVLQRRDGSWYFRKCNFCSNRTKSQKFTPDVKKGP